MRLLKIGRDVACDIVLHSGKASSLHAELTLLNNGDILLEDKGSRNGTFVMNQAIQAGSQVSIKRGDAIRFGDVELNWSQVPLPENNTAFKAVYGIGSNFRNDIQISGPTVSRFHATLKIDKKGKAFITDHSRNGTAINGQKIMFGQPVQVKRSDSVVCGGVPVKIEQFIPKSSAGKIAMIAAAVLVLLGIGYGVYKLINTDNDIHPNTTQAIENASVCVYDGFYYVITFKDDPFITKIDNWPDKWYVGNDKNGELQISSSKSDLQPLERYGTAFFISKNGELGTNRHVAMPWAHRTAATEESLRQLMEISRQSRGGYLLELLVANIEAKTISATDANAWLKRFQKSEFDISGEHAYFGIGLTGSKVTNQIDLQQAQVIAESGDPEKDVALIRLNSRKTPDYLVQMGAYYDIEKARVDETSLKPQDEDFFIVGYPMGELVSDETFSGQELHPTMHKTTLSKAPDDIKMQIQAVGIGGLSGAPVSDHEHRLVGVLASTFQGTEVTFCVNIKHLVELYEKNKVRE